MAHIGITCPPAHSHLKNLLTLGRALHDGGHQVTIFHIKDMCGAIADEGLRAEPIGLDTYPAGALAQMDARVRSMSGQKALMFAIGQHASFSSAVCTDVPSIARAIGLDAMIVDQDEAGGSSVASYLGIPWLTVSNSLALNPEPGVPPVYTSWTFRDNLWAKLRNQGCYWIARQVTTPIKRAVNQHRVRWGLPQINGVVDTFSRFAQISQQPPLFDLPHRRLPKCFHYVGPLRGKAHSPTVFPWDRLNGRPLIYASLGTLLSSHIEVFRMVIKACENFDVQLVISHVGCLNQADAASLSSSKVLVLNFVPQYELLKRACLTVTHGGLNTVLDSLSHAVPVLAIPCLNDTFGTGVRLEWTGAGRMIPWKQLSIDTLRPALSDILTNQRYKLAALTLQSSIQKAGGLERAVAIIEQVITTGRPVLQDSAPSLEGLS